MHRGPVAERLDLETRKAVFDRLQLLQKGDIGLRLLEPFENARQTSLDRIDVERGDLHGESFPKYDKARAWAGLLMERLSPARSDGERGPTATRGRDRKSTRLNSSH